MATLSVRNHLDDRILVSRESARVLEGAVVSMLRTQDRPAGAPDSNSITIDFNGIEGMAPSFLDELLKIFESLMTNRTGIRSCRFVVANPPTRLSQKFEAVARGHGMSVRALDNGSWEMAVNATFGDSTSRAPQ